MCLSLTRQSDERKTSLTIIIMTESNIYTCVLMALSGFHSHTLALFRDAQKNKVENKLIAIYNNTRDEAF